MIPYRRPKAVTAADVAELQCRAATRCLGAIEAWVGRTHGTATLGRRSSQARLSLVGRTHMGATTERAPRKAAHTGDWSGRRYRNLHTYEQLLQSYTSQPAAARGQLRLECCGTLGCAARYELGCLERHLKAYRSNWLRLHVHVPRLNLPRRTLTMAVFLLFMAGSPRATRYR